MPRKRNIRLAIVGSRRLANYAWARNCFLDWMRASGRRPVLIVSGGATGADSIAERLADEFKIPKRVHEAKWDDLEAPGAIIKRTAGGKPYNSKAGHDRNVLIEQDADECLAFPMDGSVGTFDTIDLFKRSNKRVEVVYYTR